MFVFFFFNDTATTEIYTLSLHDALPISGGPGRVRRAAAGHSIRWAETALGHSVGALRGATHPVSRRADDRSRSEEHTSELQSRQYLVCRLLLEKKTRPNRRWIRRLWVGR